MKKTRRSIKQKKASARIEKLQKDNLKLLNMLERCKVVNINDGIIIAALQKERNELKFSVREYERFMFSRNRSYTIEHEGSEEAWFQCLRERANESISGKK